MLVNFFRLPQTALDQVYSTVARAAALPASAALRDVLAVFLVQRMTPYVMALVALGVFGFLPTLFLIFLVCGVIWSGDCAGVVPYFTSGVCRPAFESGILWIFDIRSLYFGFVVLAIGFGSLIYSVDYLKNDSQIFKFFMVMLFFMLSMILLILSDSTILFFVAWEFIGLSSYLLIGFWGSRQNAVVSATKAVVVNRFTDLSLFVAVAVMSAYGVLNFSVIAGAFDRLDLRLIAFLLTVAASGKSAQFMFNGWLVSAMEGPTPVSALMHAATLVTAGVILLVKTFFIVYVVGWLVALIGCVTALYCGYAACVETDFKAVVAYSTSSQIGFMFILVGSGRLEYVFLHLTGHALFKALLFWSAGVFTHVYGSQYVFSKSTAFLAPIALVSLLVGSVSLLGLPFLTGFYTKELIIFLPIFSTGASWLAVLILSFIAQIFSAIYTVRLLFITFFSSVPDRYAGMPSKEVPVCIFFILVTFSLMSIIFGIFSIFEFFIPEVSVLALELGSISVVDDIVSCVWNTSVVLYSVFFSCFAFWLFYPAASIFSWKLFYKTAILGVRGVLVTTNLFVGVCAKVALRVLHKISIFLGILFDEIVALAVDISERLASNLPRATNTFNKKDFIEEFLFSRLPRVARSLHRSLKNLLFLVLCVEPPQKSVPPLIVKVSDSVYEHNLGANLSAHVFTQQNACILIVVALTWFVCSLFVNRAEAHARLLDSRTDATMQAVHNAVEDQSECIHQSRAVFSAGAPMSTELPTISWEKVTLRGAFFDFNEVGLVGFFAFMLLFSLVAIVFFALVLFFASRTRRSKFSVLGSTYECGSEQLWGQVSSSTKVSFLRILVIFLIFELELVILFVAVPVLPFMPARSLITLIVFMLWINIALLSDAPFPRRDVFILPIVFDWVLSDEEREDDTIPLELKAEWIIHRLSEYWDLFIGIAFLGLAICWTELFRWYTLKYGLPSLRVLTSRVVALFQSRTVAVNYGPLVYFTLILYAAGTGVILVSRAWGEFLVENEDLIKIVGLHLTVYERQWELWYIKEAFKTNFVFGSVFSTSIMSEISLRRSLFYIIVLFVVLSPLAFWQANLAVFLASFTISALFAVLLVGLDFDLLAVVILLLCVGVLSTVLTSAFLLSSRDETVRSGGRVYDFLNASLSLTSAAVLLLSITTPKTSNAVVFGLSFPQRPSLTALAAFAGNGGFSFEFLFCETAWVILLIGVFFILVSSCSELLSESENRYSWLWDVVVVAVMAVCVVVFIYNGGSPEEVKETCGCERGVCKMPPKVALPPGFDSPWWGPEGRWHFYFFDLCYRPLTNVVDAPPGFYIGAPWRVALQLWFDTPVETPKKFEPDEWELDGFDDALAPPLDQHKIFLYKRFETSCLAYYRREMKIGSQRAEYIDSLVDIFLDGPGWSYNGREPEEIRKACGCGGGVCKMPPKVALPPGFDSPWWGPEGRWHFYFFDLCYRPLINVIDAPSGFYIGAPWRVALQLWFDTPVETPKKFEPDEWELDGFDDALAPPLDQHKIFLYKRFETSCLAYYRREMKIGSQRAEYIDSLVDVFLDVQD